MRKTTRICLLIAAALMLVGGILFLASMTANHWDFTRLDTVPFETNTYEINEDFSGIAVETDTADIRFAVSEDGACRVVCFEPENMRHSVGVEDGTLTVRIEDERTWTEYIGVQLQSTTVTVCLPEAEYADLLIRETTGDIEIPADFRFESADIALSTGDVRMSASASGTVRIQTTTGDVTCEAASAGALDLATQTGRISVTDSTCAGDVSAVVTTGKTILTGVRCENLVSDGSTGSITLTDVIAAGKLSIGRSTGDVTLNDSDAAELFVQTDTGDVTGSLLSEKVFITKTSTGTVSVPKTTTGGRCEIITSTGDVRFEIDH